MTGYVDLHVHTTASDGSLTPKEIVEYAIKKNLKAIAITDHDTVAGVDEAIEIGNISSLKVVSGVEISCDEPEWSDVHIVGLFIDYENGELKKFLEAASEQRLKQKKDMIKRFNELGFDITYEEVVKIVTGEIGRPHIAKILVKKYPKIFPDIKYVFDKYLAIGKDAFVGREKKTPIKEAIQIIRKAKGIPVLAHPAMYGNYEKLIDLFIESGGKAIETYYPYSKKRKNISKKEADALVEKLNRIAEQKKLLVSGGSDFHNFEKGKLGSAKVPYSVLAELKNHKAF